MTRRGAVFVLAISLLASQAAAQEPVLINTTAVRSLRDSLLRAPQVASRRAAVEAARLRSGAVPSRGGLSLAVEVEEFAVARPLDNTMRLAAEHEFLPAAAIGAARARAIAELELGEARLAAAQVSISTQAQANVIRAAVWQRIYARLVEEDSVLVRADATLRARFAAGDARYVDVIRLRTERLRVQSEAADALAQARSAQRRLQVHDALAAQAIASVGELPLPEIPTIEALLQTAPAVRVAAAEVRVARADLATVQAESLKRWSAGVGLQRFDTETGYTVGPVFTASVALPIPQGSVRRTRILAAAQDSAAAGFGYVAAVRLLEANVAAAREQFLAARQRYQALDARLLSAAREEREAALLAYATGQLALIELLDFERALTHAEIQRLRSYLDMVDAWSDAWRAAAIGAENLP